MLADLEVLQHRQLGKDAAILGHIAQAALRDLVRGFFLYRLSHEANTALAARHHGGNAFERGGLACAIAPHQCHDLAAPHVQRYLMQDMGRAIPGVEVLDFKQFLALALIYQALIAMHLIHCCFSRTRPVPR